MSEQSGEKSRAISVPEGHHPSAPPPPPPPNYYYGTFQGVANFQPPPPPPPSSQPVIGFPQPLPPPGYSGLPPQYYRHGYQIVPGYAVVTGRPLREERLPCCGIGIGWFLEKAGLVACALAAILASIAITLGMTRAAHSW